MYENFRLKGFSNRRHIPKIHVTHKSISIRKKNEDPDEDGEQVKIKIIKKMTRLWKRYKKNEILSHHPFTKPCETHLRKYYCQIFIPIMFKIVMHSFHHPSL